MKGRFSISMILMAIIVAALLVVTGCGQKEESNAPAGDQTFEMNWAGPYVEAHPTTQNGGYPWIEEMKEKSNGRLVVHHFAPGTLCPETDNFDSTVSGAVDIGGVFAGYSPGKFILAEFMDLPLIAPNSETASVVLWEMLQKHPEFLEQFGDTKVLWAWTSAPYQIHTISKEVRTLEDMKGLKIIAWAPQTMEMVRLLGANPIEATALDTYLALERGMADGVMCPLAPLRSFKISDVTKCHAVIDIGVSPFFNVMNWDKWNSLPEDLQGLIEDSAGVEMSRKFGITLDEGAAIDTAWLADNGHFVYRVPDQEKEKWVVALSPMYDKWVKKAEDKGFANAQDMLDDARELSKAYNQ